MNKNERKSQNSVALFKIEAHLKYLQGVAKEVMFSRTFQPAPQTVIQELRISHFIHYRS